jgi:hypothetical protein
MRARALLFSVCVGAVSLWGCAYFFTGLHAQAPATSKDTRLLQRLLGDHWIRIDRGDKDLAIKYYKRISTKLALPLLDASDAPAANLTQFIEYMGYAGLTAADLQDLVSWLLMPRDQAEFSKLASKVATPAEFAAKRVLADFQNGNVLVSRFFAPKIVDSLKLYPFPPLPAGASLSGCGHCRSQMPTTRAAWRRPTSCSTSSRKRSQTTRSIKIPPRITGPTPVWWTVEVLGSGYSI